MGGRTIQRHDAFFQVLLDRPGMAGALLRERLPPDVAALLSPDQPELVPGSFVSRALRGYRTDRLYRTTTITGRPALVYALLEHKSTPDPRIALQLLGYQYRILAQWEGTEGRGADGRLRPLPALVTMVVYNGAAPWTVPLSLVEATDADPAMRPHLLDFRYSLVDLGRIPDAELSRERPLRVGLMILKHGPIGRAGRRKLLQLAREAQRLGRDDLVTLVYYLGVTLDDARGDLVRSILREVLPEEEEQVVTTFAQRWLDEGEAKGRAEGKAEGRAEGKAEMLARQIRRRFGPLDQAVEARLRTATAQQLDLWSERILDASELDQVFADRPNART